MKLTLHRRTPSLALKLHRPAMPVLMLSPRAETQLAAAMIGIRGRQGAQGPQGAGIQDDPGDLTLFIDNALI
jgi:hypothetical protein